MKAYSAGRPHGAPGKSTFAFEPGDLVSEVMSFGAPAPIEIVLFSPDLSAAHAQAKRVLEELHKISVAPRRANPARRWIIRPFPSTSTARKPA